MLTRRLFIFATTLFLASLTVEAANAAGPDYAKKGTQITWSYNNVDSKGKREKGTSTVLVTGKSGVLGRYKSHHGESKFAPGCWRCSRSGYIFDQAAYASLWPLKTGKKVSFSLKSTKSGNTYVTTIKVGKLKKVKLDFGTVEAYELKETLRFTESSWKANVTTYWAPSFGWSVKYNYKDSAGARRKASVIDVQ